MTTRSLPACAAAILAAVFAATALAACSPRYNWRDYASPETGWRVMFPAKPSTTTRTIDLDGTQVSMTMTAAEVDGATFAVGTAQAPDAARAQAALDAMKLALLRNIGAGATTSEARASASTATSSSASSDVDATGSGQGRPVRLVGHFEAHGTRFYQVIVLDQGKAVPPEQVEQFLTSFKPGP
jgi:hypothetical protein